VQARDGRIGAILQGTTAEPPPGALLFSNNTEDDQIVAGNLAVPGAPAPLPSP
jgi:hypothetical protein